MFATALLICVLASQRHWQLAEASIFRKVVSLISKFDTKHDEDFFNNIFPQIAEHIGSKLEFRVQWPSSKYEAKEVMCVCRLVQLKVIDMAEYLKCAYKDVNGYPVPQECLTLVTDKRAVDRCVDENGTSFSKEAKQAFKALQLKDLPCFSLPDYREVHADNYKDFMKGVCPAIHPLFQPYHCVHLYEIPIISILPENATNATTVTTSKRH